MPPGTSLPVAGSSPICPARKMKSPARTASVNGRSRLSASGAGRNCAFFGASAAKTDPATTPQITSKNARMKPLQSEKGTDLFDRLQELDDRGVHFLRAFLLDPVAGAFDHHLLHAGHDLRHRFDRDLAALAGDDGI